MSSYTNIAVGVFDQDLFPLFVLATAAIGTWLYFNIRHASELPAYILKDMECKTLYENFYAQNQINAALTAQGNAEQQIAYGYVLQDQIRANLCGQAINMGCQFAQTPLPARPYYCNPTCDANQTQNGITENCANVLSALKEAGVSLTEGQQVVFQNNCQLCGKGAASFPCSNPQFPTWRYQQGTACGYPPPIGCSDVCETSFPAGGYGCGCAVLQNTKMSTGGTLAQYIYNQPGPTKNMTPAQLLPGLCICPDFISDAMCLTPCNLSSTCLNPTPGQCPAPTNQPPGCPVNSAPPQIKRASVPR